MTCHPVTADLISALVSAEEPCVNVSPEDVACIEWKYPHPASCMAYIQCSSNCVTKIHVCPRSNIAMDKRLHFSNATQSCLPPDVANCTGQGCVICLVI